VAVVGARLHPDLSIVREYVTGLASHVIVVTGGAEGVDTEAEVACRASGRGVVVWSPSGPVRRCIAPGVDMHRLLTIGRRDPVTGRDAIMLRNTLIAIECDRMVVFPDGSRGGCWDAAREAVRLRRPVEIRRVNGDCRPFTTGGGS